MDDNAVFHSWSDLPFSLDEDCWGELDEAEEECPGVYYVRTAVGGEHLGRELYAVTAGARRTCWKICSRAWGRSTWWPAGRRRGSGSSASKTASATPRSWQDRSFCCCLSEA